MAVKHGSWVRHTVTSWMSSGRKQFIGLLVSLHKQTWFQVGLAGDETFLQQYEHMFDTLFNTMPANSKPVVCFLAIRASLSSTGVLGPTRIYVANKYQCCILSRGLLVRPCCGTISDEAPRMEQIRELVRTRDKLVSINNHEPENIALLPLVHQFITTYWSQSAHWNMFEGSGADGSEFGWCVSYLTYFTFLDINITCIAYINLCVGCEINMICTGILLCSRLTFISSKWFRHFHTFIYDLTSDICSHVPVIK